MKYLVRKGLVINKKQEGIIHTGTVEIESEDLGVLRTKDGFCKFKVVDGVILERSADEIKSAPEAQALVMSKRVKAYKENTDNLAMEIIFMQLANKPEEEIQAKIETYIEAVEAIKTMYPKA